MFTGARTLRDSGSSATPARWRRPATSTLCIDTAAVPLLTGALELAKGNRPGGLSSNLEHFEGGVAAAAGIDQDRLWLMYDPQTSGGLLIAAAPEHAADVDRALMRAGIAAAHRAQPSAART